MVTLAGKEVGPTGYGLMGLTWKANPVPVDDSVKAMKAAFEEGCTYFNAGEFYGTPEYNSLHILKAYFTKYPEDAEKVVLNIKGGMQTATLAPSGSVEGVQRSIDTCLKVLDGSKKIDIFECARVDPNVPIETTMKALAANVQAGKIGSIGLSEVNANTIKRAAKVHPISTVEIEMSLWSTESLTNGVLATCGELGIPVTAYAPLGHGFLTGQVKKKEDLPAFQQTQPRFQDDVWDENIKLVKELQNLAAAKGCTPAQVGIAWVNAQGKKSGMPTIIALPGASSIARIQENSKHIKLSSADLAEIDEILENFEVKGARYGGHQAQFVDA
ncbi:MAG: Pyridoxine 4-dehydrogenase [Vezdaea aestivalis]|nr:MAG: Pyridoxine 4-dehydrogenase [Vezdaea aestivalis]